jgi:Mg2+-importing ATPase
VATRVTRADGGSVAPFWSEPLPALLDRLQTDGDGLSTAEVRARLARYGPNVTGTQSPYADTFDALRRAINPLAVILLVASLVSAFLGDLVDAVIIALIVVVSTAIDLVQTQRSRRAAEQLRRRVAVEASVMRDGVWTEAPLSDLVPGDRIRLSAGDIVPADARVITANFLQVDESTFTGESLPVEKEPADAVTATDPRDARNAIFMGTVVSGGSGEALVVATGAHTTFGHLTKQLKSAPPQTVFERGLWQFGSLITRTVVALVIFVVLVNLLARRDPFESLLFAVALAVGLTPEFLPLILTVTQAQGALRMAHSKVIVRQLAAIQNFGNLDVLCSDKTGTLTEGHMQVDRAITADGAPSDRVRWYAYVNAATQAGLRSPFDDALLAEPPAEAAAFAKVGEIPYDFQRRRLSVAVATDGTVELITKGAPESVLSICTRVARVEGEADLTTAEHARITALLEELGGRGFRLLAVATRPLARPAPLSAADERDMVFQGLVAFSDPPKADAGQVVAVMRADGIRLKILTGDAPAVTLHVCAAIDLATDGILTGDQIADLDDAALQAVANSTDIFARVAPDQKLRLIRALQRSGHVVGYLGDGINDAPSLRAADVGISVAGAVDVARDAAQIVLLEKSLEVLHDGVIQGRKVFANVMKYIMMGTSSNFGNMLSMAGAVLFLPFLPLLPKQVLLNNVLYDVAQLSIPTDHVDRELIHRPRHWDMGFVRDFMLIFGPISSVYDFLTFFVLRRLFHAGEALFHTGWFVESLATQALVIFVIRTAGNPLRSRPSIWLTSTVLIVAAAGALLPWTPLAEPLGFVPVPPAFMAFVALATVTYLALVELVKRLFYRYHPLTPHGR